MYQSDMILVHGRSLPGGTVETRVSQHKDEATPRLPVRDEASSLLPVRENEASPHSPTVSFSCEARSETKKGKSENPMREEITRMKGYYLMAEEDRMEDAMETLGDLAFLLLLTGGKQRKDSGCNATR
ncbi:hypothetical protein GW17_00006809 [Ensete ventricosum]|nr:hypothetical protein GW17_00006809 [Ensete ventricosum]